MNVMRSQERRATPKGNSAGGHIGGRVVFKIGDRCNGVKEENGGIANDSAGLVSSSGCSTNIKCSHVDGGKITVRRSCGDIEGREGGESDRAETMGTAKKASKKRKRRAYI